MDPAAAARSPTVALDSAGRVAGDVPCRTCDYNLRGLLPDDRCPECGTAVGQSIHGDLLRYSDPAWVNHLAAGALLMIISVFGVIVVAGFRQVGRGTILQYLVGLAQILIGFVGLWKLTMPEPRRREQRPIWNIRQITRLLATAGLLSLVLELIVGLIGRFTGAGPIALAGMVGLFVLAGLVALLLLFIHLRRLALRIPNNSLARQTRIVMWGIIISFGIFVVEMSSGELRFVFWSGCEMVFGMLVFGIWWIVLLFRYRKEFRRSASVAKAMAS